ncbi:MAG: ATP-binding protein [Bacteroidales bacterium]|nr:ATP-binding protein [Bacteroidales bacterium]
MKKKNIKIAITGPESTGKTSLAQQLAEYYRTIWVPEFAREYLDRLQRPYQYEDILYIAQQQMKLEDEATLKAPLVFLDTELLVTKIWCEFKYGKCHQWILEEIKKRTYDLVLLCYIDIPWEYDPQREHPQQREELWNLYYHQIFEYYESVEIIQGLGYDRLLNAIHAISKRIPMLTKSNR